MNPWIRRLAMMLGIVVPGLLMIFLQVPPVLIIPLLILGAVAILFAARSITVADLKGPGGRDSGESLAEPAGSVPGTAGIGYQIRYIPGVFRDLGALLHGRKKVVRDEESRLDAIDRELERTIAGGRGKGSPATVRRPVSRVERESPKGSGGDPVLDLLDGALDSALIGNNIPTSGTAGAGLPRDRGTGTGPSVRTPGAAGGGTARSVVAAPGPALDIQFEDVDGLPGGIPPGGKPGGTPPLPAGVAPASVMEVAATPEAGPSASLQAMNTPSSPEDLEMISFASGSGTSMDELLAALKEESGRVKKRDDSNLLRGMKGVQVPGKELVDELTALLKNLRK
jgi:hypothetical protein